jgi:hypothetical protein
VDLERQISPIDLWHSQIGNHYVGPQSRKCFQRFQRIRRLGYLVALPFEHICNDEAITWVIIYDEDHKKTSGL